MAELFAQLTLRLAFGIALAMSLIRARDVPAGFFRVHLWIVMGLNTFSALLLATSDSAAKASVGLVIAGAFAAYVTAVAWLHERAIAGKFGLVLVTSINLAAAIFLAQPGQIVGILSSGVLFGASMTAMLLGHWYLNTPSMKLEPLRKLIGLLVIAALFRGLCELTLSGEGADSAVPAAWVALRWLSGIVGTVVLAGLSWQTLKIPNTQSATGLLYVVVILVFLGESISVFLTI